MARPRGRQSFIERNLSPILQPDSSMDQEPLEIAMDGTEAGDDLYSNDLSNLSFSEDDMLGAAMGQPPEHNDNLAEHLSDTDRLNIAMDLKEMIDSDEKSRGPWKRRLSAAFKALGIVPVSKNDIPFQGASDITHPLIAEAAVQFNARSYPELMPPSGPVKGKVVGEETEAKRDTAERVEDHMNYQIMEEDECYADEMDNLLMYLPLAGSAFKKTYFDSTLGYTTSKFVRGEDVLIPYNVTGLDDSPRVAIRILTHRNDLKRKQLSGLYLDIDLDTPFTEGGPTTTTELNRDYDFADGKEDPQRTDDTRHTLFEVYIDYNVPGFEDRDAESGTETGLYLPYIMTFDYESCQLLSVYRNWREQDEKKNKRKYLVHYKYLQGIGAYGFGLYHIIGGLAEACTGSVRALLDSAAFASLQGGFKSRDTNLPAGDMELTPGTWLDVDLTAEELSKAFYTPPFAEPSEALFKMLEFMESNGRRFAGTTEAVTGDAKNTGPVGTTVALIEQGTKVMSGIHRRLHRAQQREFEIRAELNAEFMPETAYWYETNGGQKYITREDYANGGIKVIPVSDPNIVSSTQRIAIAQGQLELSTQAPQLYKLVEVHRRALKALGTDDPDELLFDPNKIPQFDAVCEGSRVMAGKPVKVYPNQDHATHNMLHNAQIEFYKTLPDPQMAQKLIIDMLDHMAKHEAYRLYAETSQMQMQMSGQPLPPLDLYSEESEVLMPDEIEHQITALGAAKVQELMQFFQSRIPPPPEDQETQAKIKRQDAEAQANAQRQQADAATKAQSQQAAGAEDEKRKKLAFMGDEDRKERAFLKELAREEAKAQLQRSLEKEKNGEVDAKAVKQERDDERALKKEEHATKRKELKVKEREADAMIRSLDENAKFMKDEASTRKKETDQTAKAMAEMTKAMTMLSGEFSKALAGIVKGQETMMSAMEKSNDTRDKADAKRDGAQEKSMKQMADSVTAMTKMMAEAKNRKPAKRDIKITLGDNGTATATLT